jgi:hypothetical protein
MGPPDRRKMPVRAERLSDFVDGVAETYLAAWNEPDAGRGRQLLWR